MTVADHDAAARESQTNERTPLLAGNGQKEAEKVTPLPMVSVAILCFSRTMEPMALTVIFPFVNQMLESLGVEPSKVGYKAGIIEALFTFAQFCTILQWGRLSDRIGRKPVILLGLAGCSVSCFAFGLSRSFVAMVLTRALAGVLNGNVGVIKASLGELSDHTNEARAFVFLPPSWTLGAALGPMIGGFLADPAEQYPKYFGNNAFFLKYRYALPCFVGSIFPVIGIVIGLFFLQETLPTAKRVTAQNDAESSSVKAKVAPPSMRSLFTKRVCLTLANYAMLAFTSIANAGIFPVFLYTPVKLGGLGLKPFQMGTIMGCQAFLTTACQLLFFAPIQRRLGTVYTFRCMVVFYTLGFIMYPITSWLARDTLTRDSPSLTSVYTALGIQVFCLSMANLAYSCNMLLVNAAAPSAQLLGALNGIAQMTSSFVRSFGLVIGSSLFAFSVQSHILGGQIVWVFMILSSLGLSGTSWLVTDAKATWRDEIVEVADRDEDEGSASASAR
ncbi:MFS general substrate transporter [Cystobasidium minutum MCA 4210]|uniref:MFS general substrate transporter n=1 Tax=Cystobasidium minutum MCA 4210 TaxID=1397322 RepID=UPI0034CF6599|eukprot:jgi/Rhomi1/18496/CE18495_264